MALFPIANDILRLYHALGIPEQQTFSNERDLLRFKIQPQTEALILTPLNPFPLLVK